ncbi:MAG: dTDP-4-dehydrorhamnose reductase [Candidatus Daviesbacteria bacterium]|nr:dTDP-4-dehydrorhamnose reductase [Candidatus Daviesbacteria bacterium]
MRILILGKDGQLGQSLIKEGKKTGTYVKGYSRIELDITSKNAVDKILTLIKPNIIINTAAYHVVPDCEINADKAFQVNAIALKNLALISKSNAIKFITISSDYVFDGKKNKPYREDDKTNPLQIYGISKNAGELITLNYNPDSIIIRTCGLYGGLTGSKSKKGNFVLSIISADKNHSSLEVSSDLYANPTYSSDLASAIFQLLLDTQNKGIYHLASEGYCSMAEFAQKIAEYANLTIKIIPVKNRISAEDFKRSKFSVLSNTRARKIGIVLPSWEKSLKKYMEFLKY